MSDCTTLDTIHCYYQVGFPISQIGIEKKWENKTRLFGVDLLVADLDSDCVPEIMCTELNSPGHISAFNAKHVSSGRKIKVAFGSRGLTDYTIADIDSDGIPEIIVAAELNSNPINLKNKLVCNDIDGNIKWISDKYMVDYGTWGNYGTPALADFNRDGIPEVYIYNEIYNAQTGVRLTDGGNNVLDGGINGDGVHYFNHSVTISAQLDNDTTDLELAAGYTIYKVDMQNLNGNAGNTMTANNILINGEYRDGYTSVADINLDGTMDVIVISPHLANSLIYVYTMKTDTLDLIAKAVFTISYSTQGVAVAPGIGDIDGSRSPSIVFQLGRNLYCFKYDGTDSLKAIWDIQFPIGLVGESQLFDFNGDGILEIIYKDTDSLWILSGMTNPPSLIKQISCPNFFGRDPIRIADLYNSGQAYLCTICGEFGSEKLTVFGAPDSLPGWAPTRNMWNQYNYHGLNINDDLTVPQYMKNNATYQNGHYNNFFVQQTLPGVKGSTAIEAPNLSAAIHCVRFDPVSGVYTVSFDLYNASDASKTAPDQIPVSFYDGEPESGGQLLGTYLTTQTVAPGDTLQQLSHSFTASGLSQVVIVVNTDKTGGQPFTDEDFSIRECDFTDNFYISLDLPAIDTVQANICEGDLYTFYGTILSSPGTYYHTLTGQSGCDSLITVLQLTVSGTFVVETSVTACDGYQWRNFYETMSGMYVQVVENPHACDSLFILHLKINHSFTATESASACDSYTWQGNTYTESGTYTYTDQTIHGCDSILTLQLTIHPSEWVTLQHTACDSYTWNAQTYTLSGVYTFQTISSMGCDSIVQLDLTIVNQLEHHDDISVCAGDSVFIFDSWIQEAGDISQTFTAQSGCDSIQTYHVTIIDLPQREASATVCAGDSVFLYDRWFSVPDTYHLQLPNASGCDSLIHLEISELPVSERQEDYYLCRGDTGVVFGTMVTDAGMITTELTASTGCDSIIYTQVHLLENAAEQLSVLLCPGDSILIDGRWYAADDEVSQVFVAANGCDSTLTTRIRMIGEPSEPQMDIDCANRIIRLSVDASEDWLVMWDNGTSGSEAMYRDSTGATVNLHAIPGCDRQFKLDLPVIPEMSLYVFPGDTVVRVNEQITIDLGLDAGEWTVEWLPASVVDCSTCARVNISAQSNTDIAVRLTHESGCVYDIGFKLSIIRPNLLLPNVFSPNGDELNDTWKAVLPSDHQLISCEIFDRWGNLLFSVQQNNTVEWDGTVKGQSLMPGVYVFVMVYVDGEGKKQVLSSEITLLR